MTEKRQQSPRRMARALCRSWLYDSGIPGQGWISVLPVRVPLPVSSTSASWL